MASSSSSASDVVEYEGLNQAADWIFRGLVHLARCKVESEMELVDTTRFLFNKVVSFETLRPLSSNFDRRLITYQDEFSFSLCHSSGEEWSTCDIEALILSNSNSTDRSEAIPDSLALCLVEPSGRSLMFPPFKKEHLTILDYRIDTLEPTESMMALNPAAYPISYVVLADSNGSTMKLSSKNSSKIKLWKSYLETLFNINNIQNNSSVQEDVIIDSVQAALLRADENCSTYHFGSLQEDILSYPFKGLNIINPEVRDPSRSAKMRKTSNDSFNFRAHLNFDGDLSLIENPELKEFMDDSVSLHIPHRAEQTEFGNRTCLESIVETKNDDETFTDDENFEEVSELPEDSTVDGSLLSDSESIFSDSLCSNCSTSTLSKFEGINYTYVTTSSPILTRLSPANVMSISTDCYEPSLSTPVLSGPTKLLTESCSSEVTLSALSNSCSNSPIIEQNNLPVSSNCSLHDGSEQLDNYQQCTDLSPSVISDSKIMDETFLPSKLSNIHRQVETEPPQEHVLPDSTELSKVTPSIPLDTPISASQPPTLKRKRSTKRLFGAIKQLFKSKKDTNANKLAPKNQHASNIEDVLQAQSQREGNQICPPTLQLNGSDETLYSQVRPQLGTTVSLSIRNDRCLSKISEEDFSYENEDREQEMVTVKESIREETFNEIESVLDSDPKKPPAIENKGSGNNDSLHSKVLSGNDLYMSIDDQHAQDFLPSSRHKIRHSRSDSSVGTAIDVESFNSTVTESKKIGVPLSSRHSKFSSSSSISSSNSNFSMSLSAGSSLSTFSRSLSGSTLHDRGSSLHISKPKSLDATSQMNGSYLIKVFQTQCVVSKWCDSKWNKIEKGLTIVNVYMFGQGQGGIIECVCSNYDNLLTLRLSNHTQFRRATLLDVEIKFAEMGDPLKNSMTYLFRFLNTLDSDEFSNSINACKKDLTSRIALSGNKTVPHVRSMESLRSSASSVDGFVISERFGGMGGAYSGDGSRFLRSWGSSGSIRAYTTSSRSSSVSENECITYPANLSKIANPTILASSLPSGKLSR